MSYKLQLQLVYPLKLQLVYCFIFFNHGYALSYEFQFIIP